MDKKSQDFRFSADEFAELAKKDFRQIQVQDADALSLEHGDHKLNPDIIGEIASIKLREAAVLIPIIADQDETRVILTKRNENMRKHSGQVAFAGGAIDDGDATAENAALREAEEEIGLASDFVEPVGQLPIYKSLTGFSITPILAVVRPGFSLKANPDEVSEIFEVPLRHLMAKENHIRDSRIWQERERFFYTIKHPDHRIWGVTAGIIRTMYERLYS